MTQTQVPSIYTRYNKRKIDCGRALTPVELEWPRSKQILALREAKKYSLVDHNPSLELGASLLTLLEENLCVISLNSMGKYLLDPGGP